MKHGCDDAPNMPILNVKVTKLFYYRPFHGHIDGQKVNFQHTRGVQQGSKYPIDMYMKCALTVSATSTLVIARCLEKTVEVTGCPQTSNSFFFKFHLFFAPTYLHVVACDNMHCMLCSCPSVCI